MTRSWRIGTFFFGSFFCVGAMIFLQGCHGGAPTIPDGLTTDAQGTFLDAQPVSAQGANLYSQCPTPANQIDSRLQTGMTFETSYETVNGDRAKRILVVNAQIQSVTAQNLSEIVYPVKQVGLQQNNVPGNGALTCNASGDAGCQEPSFITLMDPGMGGQYASCTLNPTGSQSVNPTVESGKYQLASGKQVSAYRTSYSVSGELVCDGRTLGSGTQTTTTVVSMDVPAEGAVSSCGGTKLLSISLYKNSVGKGIFGSMQERIAIP